MGRSGERRFLDFRASLANQWPAPPWATDSHRFATCNVIMVQFLRCTVSTWNPYLVKISVPNLLFKVRLAFATPTNRCESVAQGGAGH